MSFKRDLEGYLLIDHTDSPGFTADQARAAGRGFLAEDLGAGKKFEAPTITCSHCQAIVVIRPNRTRARPYCRKCDHYICDNCEVVRVASGYACVPFRKILDDFRENAARGA